MTRETPGEEATPTRLQRWKGRYALVSDILTPKRLGLLIVVLLLAAVGLVGGWDRVTAETDRTPVVAAGAKVSAKPFEVEILRVRQGAAVDGLVQKADGVRFVYVIARVKVTGSKAVPYNTLIELLSVDVPGLATRPTKFDERGFTEKPPKVARVSDTLVPSNLQPGMTYDLAFAWEQDAAVAAPTTTTVTISGHTWRASTLDGSWGWRDPAPVARLTTDVLPVKE